MNSGVSTSRMTDLRRVASLFACVVIPMTLPAHEPPLQPVEQGVEDVNPLAAPSRLQPLDLRLPLGFDRVYRVVEPWRSQMDQRFARSSGALTAVFPRSQYTPTRNGTIPEIPAGTVFYIGGLPGDTFSSPPPSIRRSPTYVDLSVRGAMTPDAGAVPVPDRSVDREPRTRRQLPSIMSDEPYRRTRVCELIDRAASGSAGATSR